MIYGMYLSTMGALVQSQRHATISNNLANTQTTGFKPDWSVFTSVPVENEFHPSRMYHWDELLMPTGGGVWNDTTYTDMQEGPMQYTGNPFDVGLHNEPNSGLFSFFMVRPGISEPGQVYYSRDGHFVPDQNGVLRNVNGDAILDPMGNEIIVDVPLDGIVSILEDGRIVAVNADGQEELGQIGVFRTADWELMTKAGEALFVADGAQMVNWQNGVKQFYLEESATNAIEEMTNMIEASRVYETNMRFVTIQDTTLEQTVRRVGSWNANA